MISPGLKFYRGHGWNCCEIKIWSIGTCAIPRLIPICVRGFWPLFCFWRFFTFLHRENTKVGKLWRFFRPTSFFCAARAPDWRYQFLWDLGDQASPKNWDFNRMWIKDKIVDFYVPRSRLAVFKLWHRRSIGLGGEIGLYYYPRWSHFTRFILSKRARL